MPGQKGRTDDLQSTPIIECSGGLDATKNAITTTTGAAVTLLNYEPGLYGGYRRINGYAKYSSTEVPGTGPILGVYLYNSGVIAARGEDVYYGGGTTWTKINGTNTRPAASTYKFQYYNFNGTEKVVIVDGVNPPAIWDGTTYTVLATAPVNPAYVTVYKSQVFFGGYTTNRGAVTFSAPSDETNYATSSGAGEIVVGDEVVGIHAFRDQLIILCRNSLHKLEGSTAADFVLSPITTNLGCINGDTIQEIGGDLVYLSPDGIRTIAGTNRIGDVELESISRLIQPLLLTIPPGSSTHMSSAVVRDKSQYRLFYTSATDTDETALGFLGGIKQTNTAYSIQNPLFVHWEWAQLQGIRPYSCCTRYMNSNEYVVHGGYDGFVYQQEVGSTFDGRPVKAVFTTPDMDVGDPGIRKVFHRIISYYKAEGALNMSLIVHYDRSDLGAVSPPSYTYSVISGTAAIYGDIATRYGNTVYGQTSVPFDRKPIEGSGFLISLSYVTNDTNPPHAIQGFSFEFKPTARR